MRPVTVTVGPLAAPSANNIALTQTPSGTAPLTLNGALVSGGVAVLDTPRRVLVTVNADEHTKTLAFIGTTFGGAAASETLTMPVSGTVQTVLDYKTIISATPSASFSGAITVGTNGVASSPWVMLDYWSWPNVSLQAVVSGTVNYTVRSTLDDPNDPTNPVAPSLVTWVNSADSNVVAATGTQQSNYFFLPKYVQLLLNSQTNPGSVTMTVIQSAGVAL